MGCQDQGTKTFVSTTWGRPAGACGVGLNGVDGTQAMDDVCGVTLPNAGGPEKDPQSDLPMAHPTNRHVLMQDSNL